MRLEVCLETGLETGLEMCLETGLEMCLEIGLERCLEMCLEMCLEVGRYLLHYLHLLTLGFVFLHALTHLE